MISVEELFTGELRTEIEEFVLQRRSKLIPFMQEQVKAIRFVQERYAWFLDELFSKAVFERRKGSGSCPWRNTFCRRTWSRLSAASASARTER